MPLQSVGRWLSRPRVEVLIVFGLALSGAACGWLLREQLVKRNDEPRRETSYLLPLLNPHRTLVRDPPTGILAPPGESDRPAGRHLAAGLRS